VWVPTKEQQQQQHQPFKQPSRVTVAAESSPPATSLPRPRPPSSRDIENDYERFIPPTAAAVLARYVSPAFVHTLAAELCGEDERFTSPRAAVLVALFQRAQPDTATDCEPRVDVRLAVAQALYACAVARAERCCFDMEADLRGAAPGTIEADHDGALVEALEAVSCSLLRDSLHAVASSAGPEKSGGGTFAAASLLQHAAVNVLRCQGSALGRRSDGETGIGLEQPASVVGALSALRALHLAHAVAHMHEHGPGSSLEGGRGQESPQAALVAEGLAQVLRAWRTPLTGPRGAAACVPLQALLHALRLLLQQLDAADVSSPAPSLPAFTTSQTRLAVMVGRVVCRLLSPTDGARALYSKAACACLDVLADAQVLQTLFCGDAAMREGSNASGAWRQLLLEALVSNQEHHWHPAVRTASTALVRRLAP
jgi:hypothetical protein